MFIIGLSLLFFTSEVLKTEAKTQNKATDSQEKIVMSKNIFQI